MDVRELAFMARITAGFTHEMKNVLAIVKESAGLMEDLLALSQEASFPHRDRFLRSLGRIGEQVNRGVELSTRLNRFAHSSDVPVATVDAGEMLDQVVILAQRFARLRNVTLRIDSKEEGATLTGSSLRLQMAIFMAMECCWSLMPAGAELLLAQTGAAKGVCVTLRWIGMPEGSGQMVERLSGSQPWTETRAVVASLDGELEWIGDKSGFSIIFGKE